MKELYSLAKKFSTILENVIAGDRRSNILKVDFEGTNQNFYKFDNLTSLGKIQFWRCIDAEMADFDHERTDLKLSHQDNSKNSTDMTHQNSRYQWTNRNAEHRYRH